jgi:hypothetical protein
LEGVSANHDDSNNIGWGRPVVLGDSTITFEHLDRFKSTQLIEADSSREGLPASDYELFTNSFVTKTSSITGYWERERSEDRRSRSQQCQD